MEGKFKVVRVVAACLEYRQQGQKLLWKLLRKEIYISGFQITRKLLWVWEAHQRWFQTRNIVSGLFLDVQKQRWDSFFSCVQSDCQTAISFYQRTNFMIFSSWIYLDHLANIEFQFLACMQEFLDALSYLRSLLSSLPFYFLRSLQLELDLVSDCLKCFNKQKSQQQCQQCQQLVSEGILFFIF